MAKRLTNTEKWKTAFFRSLPAEYKLLWNYINDDCDFCGIWIVDFEVANIRIGLPVTKPKALEFFKGQIQVLPSGDMWFIPQFIQDQYGELSDKNSIHRKVLHAIATKVSNTVKTDCINSDVTVQDKDKDKVKDNKIKKEPDPIQAEIELWPTFDHFWDLYDKKNDRGKCEKTWQKLTQDDKEKIMLHLPDYKKQQPDRKFRKDPYTYLYNKSWNNEIYNNYELPARTGGKGKTSDFTPEVSATLQSNFRQFAERRGNKSGPIVSKD